MKSIYLFLPISIGIHGILFLWFPNPLSTQGQNSELEIIGLTPVVEIPQTIETPKIDPDQISAIPPVSDSLSVPLLDLSGKIPPPPDDFPLDISFDKIPTTSAPLSKLPKEPPIALPPPEPVAPKTPKQIIVPAENIPRPQPKPLNPLALSPSVYTQEFANLYTELSNKCGAENVLRTTIPSPQDELVSQISESIEPDVEWIPPVYSPTEILTGLDLTVKVTLVVESDGKISRRRFLSSDLAIIDGIMVQTLDQYEGKFKPLPGKCRLVTVNYKFPNN